MSAKVKEKNRMYWENVAKAIEKYGSAKRKPQEYYRHLKTIIIRLNFMEPLTYAKSHPFSNALTSGSKFDELNLPSTVNFNTEHPPVNFVETSSQFEEFIEDIQKSKYWALDIENHSVHSYTGIVCTLQFATEDGHYYIICPFSLRKEITESLKPLMESGNHIILLHDANNDLRHLQRDFGIFAWPAVDTQLVYRMVMEQLSQSDKPTASNVSYEKLVKDVLNVDMKKDHAATLADFRQRPLPEALKLYAIKDVMFLHSAFLQMKCCYDSGQSGISFDSILKKAVCSSMKAIYSGKSYPSAYSEMPKSLDKRQQEVFQILFNWRLDRARLQDEPPHYIMSTNVLQKLCKLNGPVNIDTLQYCISNNKEWNMILEPDFQKLSEILSQNCYIPLTLKYALTLCYKCREYSHVGALCSGEKMRKCIAEKEFYKDHPDAQEREKKRRAIKQADKRKAKGLYWDEQQRKVLPILKN